MDLSMENINNTRFILLIITFILASYHFFVRFRRKGRMANALRGPFSYPFVGNMLSFNISSPEDIWLSLRYVSRTYYPITRVWMSSEALFSVAHPDDLEILLSSQKATAKAWTYDYLHPWLRTGLLTSKGEKWHYRRRILTPAFHFNILRKYVEITAEQGEKMIGKLHASGKETVQNLMEFCSTFLLNIICESAMGVALDKIDEKEAQNYKEAIYKLGNIAVYRMSRPYIQDWMLKLVPFLKMNRDQNHALDTLHKFTNKIVQERRAYHALTDSRYLEGLMEESRDDDSQGHDVYMRHKKRLAMLDLLLSAEKDNLINDEGIKEEVDTFTFEGHDTTSMAMTFTLLLLAENKEAQERARAEITNVLSQRGGKLGMKELQDLHYLERCVKESLRLYPPVSTVLRYTDEDLELKNAKIPGKTSIICHFYDTHRDPNFWDDPDDFKPDRFLPENSQNRHPFAYVPFSAGPRNCIGQKFALNELKSLIGLILYHFKLEPVTRLKDVKLIADLVLRPSEPAYLKFVKLDKSN